MSGGDPTNRRHFIRRTVYGGLALGALTLGQRSTADEQAWADVTGQFIYDGTAPPRKKLKVDKDVDCCGKFDIRDESLMVDSDSGGLANVFVYCRARRLPICPDLEKDYPEKVVLDNIDCIFKPHCMLVWNRKQVFEIVNSDPVAQNVAFRPLGDTAANIVLPPPPDEASTVQWRFRRAQRLPVPIACNYHPWESAYVLPTDTPYAAISESDGRFRIPKLPVGQTLEFQLWQERTGPLETDDWPGGRLTVTVEPGGTDLGQRKLPPELFEVDE
jgi:hypothetical protein